MKKIITSLFVLFAAFLCGNAQLDQIQAKKINNALRFDTSNGIDLPAGFTYADRVNAKKEKMITGIGTGNTRQLFAGYDVSFSEGSKIKGVSYFLSRIKENTQYGKVVVASRPAGDLPESPEYTIEFVQNVDQVDGLNQFTFPTPIDVKAGKSYLIGYQTYASGQDDGFPLLFVGGESVPRGSIMTLGDGSKKDIVGAVGEKIEEVFSIAELNFGNAAIVIDVEDPSNPDNVSVILTISEESILAKLGDEVSVEAKVLNNSLVDISDINVSLMKGKQVVNTVNIANISSLKEGVAKFVFPTDKPLSGKYTIQVVSVNGKEMESNVKTFSLKVIDPKEWVFGNSVLVERFTTEKCGNCPSADGRMDAAFKKLQGELNIVKVYHHAGFYTDFLTIQTSVDIEKKFGVNFAPSMMVNRFANKEIYANDPNSVGGQTLVLFPNNPDDIMNIYRLAAKNPYQTKIERISRIGEGADTKIVVEGKTLATDPDDIYLSVWRTEDGISASNGGNGQAGGGSGFVHDNVIRKSYTPSFGQEVTLDADKTFKVEVPVPDFSTDWDADKMHFVVFLHRSASNEVYERYVHEAQSFRVDATVGVREVSPENRPVAFVENGKIVLKGMYDSYKVFDIMGREMNCNDVLPAGVYVVKALRGTVDYVSKVVVR